LTTAADALARLSRLHGPAELRAAALALGVQPASEASLALWTAETTGLPRASAVLADARQVGEGARLPVLEALLARLCAQPKEERRRLLQSARRLMAAHAPHRPLDRLHWLWMRRRLGDTPPAPAAPGVHDEPGALPAGTLAQIAGVTAYLARMVPGGDAGAARAWAAEALRRFAPAADVPLRPAPDGDGFAHGLEEAAALPWMLRPVLVRAWVGAAIDTSGRARLPAVAADALKLAADLLDSPLPPDLARHFEALDWR
jgi:hypothetical protein